MKFPSLELRTSYILFISIIQLILITLSFQLIFYNPLYFVIAELFIVVSLLFAVQLYIRLIKPINLISSGIELLKEKDFNTRMVRTGQAEIDSIIEVYNKLADQLREEKIRQIEQNNFLDKLMQASPSGIILLDLDGRIVSFNPAVLKMLQVPDYLLNGKKLNEIKGVFAQELFSLSDSKSKLINFSGTQFYRCYKSFFIDRGFQRHFYIIEEVTQEMLNAQRKSYEKVIRMMAHEINNSIGAVNSFLQSFMNYKTQLKAEDQSDFINSLTIAIDRNTRTSPALLSYRSLKRKKLI